MIVWLESLNYSSSWPVQVFGEISRHVNRKIWLGRCAVEDEQLWYSNRFPFLPHYHYPEIMAKTMIAPPKISGKNPSITFKDKDKPDSIRSSNIVAAKAVADAIRTSLGPKGMDKMIETGKGEVTITNDGATILKQMSVIHPAAKMLVELSKAQDIEAGDGTTTVVVIAGALLDGAEKLLNKGIHPTTISESFQRAAVQAEKILESMASPVDLDNDDQLAKIATTSLNSKVVSQHSWLLAPMAVNAIANTDDNNVDLRMIKIVKKVGETVEESRLVDGALIDQKSMGRGGPTRVEKAQIGLIQFQLSPPKTDMENQVILSDYTQMDRALKEERMYLLDLCKQIKKAGCNVLLIQKSILREDIEFYSRILGCRPIASIDHFVPEALGSADLVEQIPTGGDGKIIQVTGVQNPGQAVSVLIRGSNKLVLEEAERSFHDALCVIRCLVKKSSPSWFVNFQFLFHSFPFLISGGAPEMEVAVQLRQLAQKRHGAEQYCWRAFADALEQVPYTLAENAGLNPIATVTELRAQHANGKKNHGVNVRKGYVTDIREENVLQPLLVSSSAIKQAAECVRSILKIDDIVLAVRS
ncbi:T-complex protein 1 subunit delta [Dirofilaria immitis]|nr:T-complex protein 1 subunit delta [Dirofilaria immitis]